jgi:hypothetical protein
VSLIRISISPAAWVVSLNLRCRHLYGSQLALAAAKLANLGEGRLEETASIEVASQARGGFSGSDVPTPKAQIFRQ